MANAPAHIDEEGVVRAGPTTVNKLLAHREEAIVHPAWPAETVDGHVVVELLCREGILLRYLEEMEICVESELKSCVGGIGWVVITVLFQLGWEGVDSCGEAACPITSNHHISRASSCECTCAGIHQRKSIAVLLHAQGHSKPRTTVLIRAGFLDHPHRSQVFEQPSWEPVSRFKQHDLDGEKPT